MRVLILTAVVLVAGCASAKSGVANLPAAKAAYCAAISEETREAIREKHGLPHVVRCSSDA